MSGGRYFLHATRMNDLRQKRFHFWSVLPQYFPVIQALLPVQRGWSHYCSRLPIGIKVVALLYSPFPLVSSVCSVDSKGHTSSEMQ